VLTGDQIAAARRLAGIRSQAELAAQAGVSRPTVERAEAARNLIPSMNADAMARIIRALEAAGIEFHLDGGASLAGDVGMRRRATADEPNATRPGGR
jgi:transcriptional regulator with XRE-family HTH domain